jgi:hypothetical protein
MSLNEAVTTFRRLKATRWQELAIALARHGFTDRLTGQQGFSPMTQCFPGRIVFRVVTVPAGRACF